MKRNIIYVLLLVTVINLAACRSASPNGTGGVPSSTAGTQTQPAETTLPPTTVPETTVAPTTVPETTVPPTTEPEETESRVYIPEDPILITPETVGGRMYIFERIGSGGFLVDKFWIMLNEDGTFNYFETCFSSHAGMGTWDVEGDVLTMYEDEDRFYFRITEEALVFMEENEDNFLYVRVNPGERFFAAN